MDLERSLYLIGEAEVRLDFQRAAVARMRSDIDPIFAALARELVCLMQDKIVIMKHMHEAMLNREPYLPAAVRRLMVEDDVIFRTRGSAFAGHHSALETG